MITELNDGWYFIIDDEDFGPYLTKEDAETALATYNRYIIGSCPNCGDSNG